MRKREFLNVIIMLLLTGLLFACQINPGGGGTGGGSGGGQGNNTGGGGVVIEPTIKLTPMDIGETAGAFEWTAVAGVENYELMIAGGGDKHVFYSEYSGPLTRHVVEELVPGETYYVQVTEKVPYGTEVVNISNIVTITTPEPSLSAMGAISSTVTAHSATLSWNAVVGASYYRVFRLEHNNWRHYYSSVNEPTFTDTRLGEKERDYSYKLVAYSADGTKSSGFSELVTVTTAPITLALPNITMNVRSYEIEWSWPALGANEMMLYEKATDREMTEVISPVEITGMETGYKAEGLLPGTEQFYRFRLINKVTGAASKYSKLFIATTSLPELTVVPTNIKLVSLAKNSLNPGYYDIEISWDAFAGADEYHIYSDEYSRDNFMLMHKVTTANYKNLVNSTFNPEVRFKIRAIKKSTNEGSGFSEPLPVNFM